MATSTVMPPKKPPLDVVRTVRGQRVDRDKGRLAEELAAEAKAEAAARDAAERERRGREAARAAVASERALVATVADLARHAAFVVGQERAMDLQAEETERTAAAARTAAERAAAARDQLAVARTELEVVERHQETVHRRELAAREAKELEQAEDAHAARRPR